MFPIWRLKLSCLFAGSDIWRLVHNDGLADHHSPKFESDIIALSDLKDGMLLFFYLQLEGYVEGIWQ